MEYLTIPSQRRYVQYFTNMLGGLKPSSTPLLLRRVIMKTIPNYSKNKNIKGCCPYIQVFQCGKLIATAAPRSSEKEPPKCIGKSLQLKWVDCSEGSISFTVDCPVQVTNVLTRCTWSVIKCNVYFTGGYYGLICGDTVAPVPAFTLLLHRWQ